MRELVVTSKLSDFDLHTYLGWMYQREGDNMKAIEYFQKALSHSIHEVQRLAIAQLSKTLSQDVGFGIPKLR